MHNAKVTVSTSKRTAVVTAQFSNNALSMLGMCLCGILLITLSKHMFMYAQQGCEFGCICKSLVFYCSQISYCCLLFDFKRLHCGLLHPASCTDREIPNLTHTGYHTL